MIELTTHDIARRLGGHPVGDDVTVAGLGADSRALPDRALFVALPPRGVEEGERDGHDFLAAAADAGAAAALVQREDALPVGLPGIVVEDTWRAIAELAGSVRRELAPRVVALTGSVGKTTTKDLVLAACQSSLRTIAARGSFNNELGVPLTLLSLERDTELAVVEIGARGVGHVASLMPAVQPDVSIVTVVAGAHLEQFGDLDTVAVAKGEIVEGLGPHGTAVLNHDDHRVRAMRSRHAGKVLTFSADGDTDADLRAAEVTLDDHARASFLAQTPWGDVRVTLPLAGRHHVTNALAALGAAGALGVPLQAAAAGLATAQISAWRSSVEDVGDVRVLNDAYNANPTSMIAALDSLADLGVPGRRWAVLGIMAELGPDHEDGHLRAGRRAGEVADVVLVVGDAAGGIAVGARDAGATDVRKVPDVAAALDLLDEVAPGDAVLVKASRSGGLEKVAEALVERLRDTTTDRTPQ